jgi:hypothetical protein
MYSRKLLSSLSLFAIISDVAASHHSSLKSRQEVQQKESWLSNSNSIQYFCILDGEFIPNATLDAQGCGRTQTPIAHWLVNMYIGSVQNGTQSFDRNPWDFSLQTILNLDGDFDNLVLWNLNFASSGLFIEPGNNKGEFDGTGGVTTLNLAPDGTGSAQVQRMAFADTAGFIATGDQSGYVGNSSFQNAVQLVSANFRDFGDLPNCPPYYQWFYW